MADPEYMELPMDSETAIGLQKDLSRVYAELRSGDLEDSEAEALANVAGKMISISKVQVAYYALRKEIPFIKFLKDDSSQ